MVFDAIVRSKLLYGLESTAINETVKHTLDIFQFKGLRKILGFKTTFIDRRNDAEKILTEAQTHIDNATPPGKWERQIKRFSQVYEERKVNILNNIINLPPGAPTRSMTFKGNTLHPVSFTEVEGTVRRSGKPRVKWLETTLDPLWKIIGLFRNDLRYTIMNLNNGEHVEVIRAAATANVHTFSPNFVLS